MTTIVHTNEMNPFGSDSQLIELFSRMRHQSRVVGLIDPVNFVDHYSWLSNSGIISYRSSVLDRKYIPGVVTVVRNMNEQPSLGSSVRKGQG